MLVESKEHRTGVSLGRREGETECSNTVSFDVNITWVASKLEPLNDLKT